MGKGQRFSMNLRLDSAPHFSAVKAKEVLSVLSASEHARLLTDVTEGAWRTCQRQERRATAGGQGRWWWE